MPVSRPRPIVAVAAIVAFLISLSLIALGLTHLPLLVLAIPSLAAGALLLRRHVWAAYGFALVELLQATLAPLALFLSGSPARALLVSVVFGLAVAALFFFAGRSLEKMESPRGWPAPWIAAALLLSVPFFFFQPFAASTGGMEDTLLRGDHLVARKLPALTPRDGEIWVFHYPDDPKQIFIKRILGVAGDRIHIASGVVYRNGQRLDEPYAVHRFDNVHMYGWDLPVDSSQVPKSPYVSRGKAMLEHNVSGGSIVVPRGKYFVLGDNRENSLDSRHFGFVDQSELIGKALFIYDSTGPDKRERRNRIFKGL